MAISTEVKNKLNENAIKYYMAEKNNNKEKLDKVCDNLNIDKFGWDCIGNGSGRNVFDMNIFGYDKYIVKLAIHHPQYDGIKQNKHEIKLWNTMTNEQKEFIVPIIDSGINNCWIIMPKGKSNPHIGYDWIVDAKYCLHGLIWKEDIKEDNIVTINGKPKICDYGTPPQ